MEGRGGGVGEPSWRRATAGESARARSAGGGEGGREGRPGREEGRRGAGRGLAGRRRWSLGGPGRASSRARRPPQPTARPKCWSPAPPAQRRPNHTSLSPLGRPASDHNSAGEHERAHLPYHTLPLRAICEQRRDLEQDLCTAPGLLDAGCGRRSRSPGGVRRSVRDRTTPRQRSVVDATREGWQGERAIEEGRRVDASGGEGCAAGRARPTTTLDVRQSSSARRPVRPARTTWALLGLANSAALCAACDGRCTSSARLRREEPRRRGACARPVPPPQPPPPAGPVPPPPAFPSTTPTARRRRRRTRARRLV